MKFLKNIVKSAGRGIKRGARGVSRGVKSSVRVVGRQSARASRKLGKVPVIGKGLKGAFDLTLNNKLQTARAVSNGVRIDKVAMRSLKRHVRSVKDVGPYARMVISTVPGVGSGVNAAIGAGLALAEGQPISQAMLQAVKGALPGGIGAQLAFDVGVSAISGKSVSPALIKGLPLSNREKSLLSAGLKDVNRLANGKKVSLATVNQALNFLPPDSRKGLEIGIAMAEGKKLQNAAPSALKKSTLRSLQKRGTRRLKTSSMLRSARSILQNAASRRSYAVGLGLTTKRVKPIHVTAIRKRLGKKGQKGFDLALSTHVGLVQNRGKTPKKLPPKARLGYYATAGIAGASKQVKSNVIKPIAAQPATRPGAALAVKKSKGFWTRLKELFFPAA